MLQLHRVFSLARVWDTAADWDSVRPLEAARSAAAVCERQARLLLVGGQLDVVREAQRAHAGDHHPRDVELPPLQAVPRATSGSNSRISYMTIMQETNIVRRT